ncbi:hypothetical protein A3H75_01835 [Candidatus Uhrbacteria bacterium RIFCSPLOWO2_02_FULL_51_9]|uniref:POTRA domain-containing protein n=1 Tax=Candidatus Uhrbacteria bacterium RIFCSPLOWO2_02_FULL_51_9 TaxID=1802410 RepID=A0A1F7VD83_9BACT|nr:MAG: hypothetical protein A3H75_01835 [Candidatus Uhrbacteria bacterium RIFCSPLOWO2_02_FULL_51_9]
MPMNYRGYAHVEYKQRKRWFKRRGTNAARADVGYANPYNRKEKSALRPVITGSALALTLMIWAVLLIFHPYFIIKHIAVSGLSTLGPQEIQQAVRTALERKQLWFIPQNNFFLLNRERLEKVLLTRFPLERVTITTSFPSTVHLEATERLAFVIYDDGAKYVLIDEGGIPQKTLRPVAIHETQTGAKTMWVGDSARVVSSTWHYPDRAALHAVYGAYPVVYNQQTARTSAYLLDPIVVRGVLQIYLSLKQDTDFATHHFVYPSDYQTLLVINENGPTVSFNPFENLEKQLETFKHAWQRELRKEKHRKILINARYPGRVYVEE